jgi:hypothetical protein
MEKRDTSILYCLEYQGLQLVARRNIDWAVVTPIKYNNLCITSSIQSKQKQISQCIGVH